MDRKQPDQTKASTVTRVTAALAERRGSKRTVEEVEGDENELERLRALGYLK